MQRTAIRGVNLGGWLVLEQWVTPSLFAGVSATDEYTFCRDGSKRDLQKLQRFRDQFVTKDDFYWLAHHGIEAVRLPIGYWAFGEAPPYQPTIQYIDKAFTWAREVGLKILLDLHGAYQSQNGQEHSGRSGEIRWHLDHTNTVKTLNTIQRLVKRYGKHPMFLGISLLNEPSADIPKDVLLQYYHQAYTIVREACREDTWIIYDDGYKPKRWQRELPAPSYKNVYIDSHQYQVFSLLDKLLPPHLNMLRARFQLPLKMRSLFKYHPVIIGEWSLALDNNTLKRLNILQQNTIMQQYARIQLNTFQTTAAWFFWTYKTEQGGAWSFRDCITKGYIPDFNKSSIVVT